MKRMISGLLVVLLASGFIPSGWGSVRADEAAAPNLLQNGGFEQTATAAGWVGNVSALSWTRYVFTGTPLFAVDSSVAHSGSKSVRLEASPAARGTVYQQTNAVAVGKTYKVSGWMKTEMTSGKGLVRFQVGRTSGGNLLVNMAEAAGTKDWFYFERTVTIPDNATSPAWLKVEAFLETGTGKVWFDDLAVQEWNGVQSVSITPATLSLQPGEIGTLTPQFQPDNATNRNVTWTSSNEAVATVSDTGTVSAHANGYAFITVKTADGGYTYSSVVSVGAPATLTVEPYAGTVLEDGELAGLLSAHDSTGAAVTFEKIVEPKNGKLTVFPDGRFLYYPNPDFNGTDEFTYMAKTSQGGPGFARATVQVRPVNDAPALDLKWSSTPKNTVLNDKLQQGTDKENQTLVWSKVADPEHGTLQVNADGTYIYTPQNGFTGYDGFRVAAQDPQGGRTEGSVRVFVVPAQDDFMSQFRSQPTYGEHPRLLAGKADFDRTRSLIGTDSYVSEWYGKLKALADPVLATVPLPYASNGTNNSTIRDRLLNTALMYQLSGDARYAQRTIQELEALAGYADWGDRYNNILAMAELATPVALAYDWVYDAMTEAQRTLVADAIRVKVLNVANDWYRGVFTHNGEFNNINLVDNGNFGLAALAIADENPAAEAAAKQTLAGMYKKLQLALRHYTPDGAWPEGPAYWHYGGQYLSYMIAAMNRVLGTDYGLSALDGFEESGAFPLHLLGEGGYFDFFDGGISMAQPESMWFADFFGKPEFAWHLGDLYRRKGVFHPLYLVLYKPGMFDVKPTELDQFYSAIESGSMRSAWDDPNALFASMKGVNETLKSHFDLDAGTFVFDALGTRWAMDSGNESYSLPGYWDYTNQRWTYYRKTTEGHNTIVINPAENPVVQQDPWGTALRIREESKPRGAFSVLDMTDVYKRDAVSMKRGMMLTADRTQLIVQDEMKLKTPSELYWFMHTKASIDIIENGRAAILKQGDKRLYAKLLEAPEGAAFSVMDAEPLPTSPNPADQSQNFGVRKLAVHMTGVQETNLAVWLVPLYDTDEIPSAAPAFTPLAAWSIPDGALQPQPTRPTLDGLTVDGQPVQGFTPKGTYYEVPVPFEATAVPVVAATSAHTVTIEQAAGIPGMARVIVKDRTNPSLMNSYTIAFKRLPMIGDPPGLQKYEIAGVTASAVPEAAQGNTPEKTIDGNLDTRWSAAGKQWIQYDLGGVKTVSAVSVAIFNGNTRRAYYDLEASTDGKTWTKLFSGESSGTTVQPETLLLQATPAKYVRLVGSGNSANNYNSITEVMVYGPPPVSGVELDRSELVLSGREREATLTARVLPDTAENRSVRWTTADPNVATVNANGTVTAVGDGRTTVTAVTYEGGFTASATVTVDLTAPQIVLNVPARVWQSDSVTLNVYADDAITGVSSLSVTLDGSPRGTQFTIAPLELSVGEHTVRVVAVDRAGNEAVREFVLGVDVDASHLSAVVQAGAAKGWIRNESVVKNLIRKAEQAAANQDDAKKLKTDLNPFVGMVQEATDEKSIDPAFAGLLLQDVDYILKRSK
ncbi:Ig-like domain-containing protein [Paenibacillus sp. HJGM_3]|uniref:Ig-like domain-containing protein n=1 Tax=Paenibacillus sp. HJGM_3 TaxID=3379816 RepID=UPI00385A8A4C